MSDAAGLRGERETDDSLGGSKAPGRVGKNVKMFTTTPEILECLAFADELGDYPMMRDVIAGLDDTGKLTEAGTEERFQVEAFRELAAAALAREAAEGISLRKADHPFNVFCDGLVSKWLDEIDQPSELDHTAPLAA